MTAIRPCDRGISRRELLRLMAAGVGAVALQSCAAPPESVSDLPVVTSVGSTPKLNGTENPVVAENRLPGSPNWQITSAQGDIAGFASAPSVNRGQELTLYVNTDAERYDILIYRSGYYGGVGGRLIQTLRDLSGQRQVASYTDHATGLTSCAGWAPSVRLQTGADWTSGIYIAKLVRHDTGGENHIYFVLRDDARPTDILYQQSFTTYHAYNNYGGKSLYNFNSSSCPTASEQPRAVAVSLRRPLSGLVDPYVNDRYLNVEYPLVRWLEAQGYDLSYCTSLDTHRWGATGTQNAILNHRAFISSGHDEYWSAEMRAAVTAARDAGVHLCFFSSNVSYWRVRFAPDPVTGEPDAVMICYKSTESGSPDPSGHATGTWRDPAGAAQPENALVGIQYIGDNDQRGFPLRISAEQARDPIFRHTGINRIPTGSYVEIGHNLVGWEWDGIADNGLSPPTLQIITATPVYGPHLADSGRLYKIESRVAHATRYVAQSGAIVFSAGTNRWSWGLEVIEPDRRLQQITLNLLADMGVQAATPAADLILDESGDATAPHAYQIAATGSPLLITNVEIVPASDSLTFRWETDRPASGQVWLRGTPGESWPAPIIGSSSHSDFQDRHEIVLRYLDPQRQYYAQIAVGDTSGQVTITSEYAVSTIGGTLLQDLKGTVKPLYRQYVQPITCFAGANPVVTATACGALVAGLGGWFTLRRYRVAPAAQPDCAALDEVPTPIDPEHSDTL